MKNCKILLLAQMIIQAVNKQRNIHLSLPYKSHFQNRSKFAMFHQSFHTSIIICNVNRKDQHILLILKHSFDFIFNDQTFKFYIHLNFYNK